MKKIALNALFIMYSIGAVFVLMYACLAPLALGFEDFPTWTLYIVYPLSIFIIASGEAVENFFNKHEIN